MKFFQWCVCMILYLFTMWLLGSFTAYDWLWFAHIADATLRCFLALVVLIFAFCFAGAINEA